MSLTPDTRVFPHPFSKEYWRLSAAELKSVRVLVLAALLTALRIAIKSMKIMIGPDLSITFGFLVNSVGSMIYGPVVAILTSAISDTLGAILFPSGTYFFPFIFEEIAGGLLFALFFYRAKLSTPRVIAGRFSVTLICNLLMNPVLLYYYYLFVLGKSYKLLSLPRIIKNLALFPLQCLILVILFNALVPFTNRMGLTHTPQTKLEIRKRDIVWLVVLTLASATFVAGYYWYKGLGA